MTPVLSLSKDCAGDAGRSGEVEGELYGGIPQGYAHEIGAEACAAEVLAQAEILLGRI